VSHHLTALSTSTACYVDSFTYLFKAYPCTNANTFKANEHLNILTDYWRKHAIKKTNLVVNWLTIALYIIPESFTKCTQNDIYNIKC
jgi:hypothetical protein